MSARTVLVSNIPHYHYLAQALWEAGYLERYITSAALVGTESPPAWLPVKLRRKLEGRRISGVPAEAVRRIYLPEAVQRIAAEGHLCSRWQANTINNHWFDWRARRYAGGCEILHFVSSVGLYCARRAQRGGATIICDCREEHPRFLADILNEEGERAGIRPKLHPREYERKVTQELEIAGHIVTPSRFTARTYAKHCPGKQIHVIPYGVDLAHFRPSGKPDDVFRVVFCGRATLRKGVHYLVEAFQRLKLPNSELVIAGSIDGDLREFLAARKAAFRYIENVAKADLHRLYSSGSVLVIPSISDAFGLVVFEALACGLPVIATDHVGSAELITDGREGFIIPIRNTEALQEKLTLLHRSPDLLAEMRRAAVALARRVGWRSYQDQMVAFYQELTGSHKTGAELGKPSPAYA